MDGKAGDDVSVRGEGGEMGRRDQEQPGDVEAGWMGWVDGRVGGWAAPARVWGLPQASRPCQRGLLVVEAGGCDGGESSRASQGSGYQTRLHCTRQASCQPGVPSHGAN